jgi:hypothetical protein
VHAPVAGRVGFDGSLDLAVDLMPLVEAYGGGVYAAAAKVATSIPVRIGGTVRDPTLKAPTTKDVATSLLGGALRRAVTSDP